MKNPNTQRDHKNSCKKHHHKRYDPTEAFMPEKIVLKLLASKLIFIRPEFFF